MKAKQFMFGLVLSAVMGGGIAIGGYKLLDDQEQAQEVQSLNQNVRYSSLLRNSDVKVPEGLNFITAAETVTPAVVHVNTEYGVQASRGGSRQRDMMDPFLRDFFGDDFENYHRQQGPSLGSGSGVIISSNGYIVTNNHVIDKADKIEVVLDDKRKFEATLVGTDPSTDLALLKVNANNLPTIRYGNSDNLRVGEWVLAVGNPFNLNSTVTAGIISAKGRNVGIIQATDDKNNNVGIESFLQTDAVVNPGNSGGALVNLNGDLVGINTAIASRRGSFEGYSFAVPSAIVSKVVDDLLKYGEVQRALLGIRMQEVDAKLAEEKKIKNLNGIYVVQLTENSAAQAAGLKAGDIITHINNIPVNTSAQLQEQVARYRPGDKIKVTYVRGSDTETVTATLRNRMGDTNVVKREVAKAITFSGAKFSPLSKDELNKLNLEGGAKISNVRSSEFKNSGIEDGFIITRIDKAKVEKPQDVERLLKNAKEEGVLVEGIYPDGRRAYYPIGRG
ncbi:serine protease [Adhaeribacter aerolatus]|uniref:Serine protease n=1 Tax=Adhaeribacter aerolatus TaxID=670289 RepID=A0A512ARS6_9BACT|nr:Do family serine endopeptidase [Adhaeribacter aerolatus]GEO02392.1 serine protease [Adhaeribacter aerolatus]